MTKLARLGWRALVALVLWIAITRVLVRQDGATPEERVRRLPGDELVPTHRRRSTMATTIGAPPWAVWPWLIQMGTDRAGFYSWDRIDNSGKPSATSIHPEWQLLAVGDHIVAGADGRIWFEVAYLEPEQLLVLHNRVDYRTGRTLPNQEPNLPGVSGHGVWSFMLHPVDDGRATRLVVRALGDFRPRAVVRPLELVFSDFVHWLLQVRQFQNLAVRAEALVPPLDPDRPSPLVASLG